MAKLHTLQDNFPGTSLSSQWTSGVGGDSSATTSVSSNKVTIGIDSASLSNHTVYSTNSFSLENSSIMFQITSAPTSGTGHLEFGIRDHSNGNNLKYWCDASGSFSSEGISVTGMTYSTNMWVRIRHSGTTLYMDSSSDGIAFTNRGSVSVGSGGTGISDLTNVRAEFVVQADGGSGTASASFAKVNISQTTDRYVVATGNWSSTSVWSYSSTGIGGAIPPTINDDVLMTSNYTLTVDVSEAQCSGYTQTNGTFNLSGNDFTTQWFFYGANVSGRTVVFNAGSGTLNLGGSYTQNSAGSTSTINMGTATWNFDPFVTAYPNDGVQVNFNTALTLNSEQSIVKIYQTADGADEDHLTRFTTGSHTYNDVYITLGQGVSNGTLFEIIGSSTFNTLVIQSKNSFAHTVTFDSDVTVMKKFVAVGSSTSNKLTLGDGSVVNILFGNEGAGGYGTSYGQYVNAKIYASGRTSVPKFIGSNSVQDVGRNWLLQDPPKALSIIDPLTLDAGSNTNFDSVGDISYSTDGANGGGYIFDAGVTMLSKNTYDLIDSSIIVEVVSAGDSLYAHIDDFGPDSGAFSYSRFNKYYISGSTFYVDGSDNGNSWSTIWSEPVVDPLLFRSSRVSLQGTGGATIGSINGISANSNTGAFFAFFYP